MSKFTPTKLTSLQNETSAIAKLNANFDAIKTAIENTFSRDGSTPNSMGADLDMNSNRIINLPTATTAGEPLEYTQGQTILDTAEGYMDAAEGFKNEASGFADDAQDYANDSLGYKNDAQAILNDINTIYDNINDWYIGEFGSNPTADNDGDPLTTGDLYYNSTTNEMRVYTGDQWINIAAITALSHDTFSNKSIDLTNNTLTGTLAEFNTALSDDNFASLTGSETLTNKSIDLTDNTVTGTKAEFNTAISDANLVTITAATTTNNLAKFSDTNGNVVSSSLSEDSSGNVSITGDLTVGDDVLLGSGAVINFDSGDVTLTHSNNNLSLTGDSGFIAFNVTGSTVSNNFITTNGGSFLAPLTAGAAAHIGAWDVDGAARKSFLVLVSNNTPTCTMHDVTCTTDLTPTTNDGASLGTTTNKWSDLHLASGGVINFDDGNFTITHSNNALTLAADSGFGSINYTGNLRSSNFIPNNGGAFLANTIAGNTAHISAWDVDGATTKAFITLTSNNTPTCTIQDVTINSSTIGSDCTATTQSASDDSTKIATTAFVKDVAEPLGLSTINTQTGTTYTFVLADQGKLIRMTNSSSNVITIPTNASVAFPTGTRIDVAQAGTGVTSVLGDTGVTLNGVSAGSGSLSQQYGAVCLVKTDSDTWEVYGAIGTVS